MIDVNFNIYRELVDGFGYVFDTFDKWNEESFEKWYLEERKRKGNILFRTAAPRFLFNIETALNETSDLLREFLQHERQCDKVPYIEYPENPTDEELKDWEEREDEASRKFCEKVSKSLTNLRRVYDDTFKYRLLRFGTRKEVLEYVYDDFTDADEFKDFTLCKYNGWYFVNMLGEWDDFTEAEVIEEFHENEFAKLISDFLASCNTIECEDTNNVFEATMIDSEEFCDVVELYFEHKKNKDVDNELVTVFQYWL